MASDLMSHFRRMRRSGNRWVVLVTVSSVALGLNFQRCWCLCSCLCAWLTRCLYARRCSARRFCGFFWSGVIRNYVDYFLILVHVFCSFLSFFHPFFIVGGCVVWVVVGFYASRIRPGRWFWACSVAPFCPPSSRYVLFLICCQPFILFPLPCKACPCTDYVSPSGSFSSALSPGVPAGPRHSLYGVSCTLHDFLPPSWSWSFRTGRSFVLPSPCFRLFLMVLLSVAVALVCRNRRTYPSVLWATLKGRFAVPFFGLELPFLFSDGLCYLFLSFLSWSAFCFISFYCPLKVADSFIPVSCITDYLSFSICFQLTGREKHA